MSLFPSIDADVRESRLATRREQRQQARTYLANRDLNWLANYLFEHGPKTDHQLALLAPADSCHFVWADLTALWIVGKFWRISRGIHPTSGCEMFLFGIKGVHKRALSPTEPPA